MLNKKSIYALLFTCVTHLGCSSGQYYQMHSGGDAISEQSTSKGGEYHTDVPGNINIDKDKVDKIYKMLNTLLEDGRLKRGRSLTNEEIDEVIRKTGSDISSSDLDKYYKEFLTEYGSIYGKGFTICGPTKSISKSESRINYMTSLQLGFQNTCKLNGMKDKKEKSCWLMAEVDQGEQYYIGFSKKSKKYYINSMSHDGSSEIFTDNFIDFLEKFLNKFLEADKSYHIKSQEQAYQEEFYE